MKKFLLLILFPLVAFSQQSKVGEWSIHSPYRDAIAVADAGDRVYCAASTGLFYYSKKDGAVERITKLSGISDIEFSTIKYIPSIKALIIGYKNGNIDLLYDNGTIANFSDIKRKSIAGLKSINHIFSLGSRVYFSCGFGIVVLNIEKKEFEDTYFISSVGQTEVFSATSDGTYLYAATKKGFYKGLLTDNLADFSFWIKLSSANFGLPEGAYSGVAALNNKIFTSFSYPLSNNLSPDSASAQKKDTVYVIENNSWRYLDTSLKSTLKKLETSAGKLALTTREKEGIFYSYNEEKIKTIKDYWFFHHPVEFIADTVGGYWIADAVMGLLKYQEGNYALLFTPNSPFSKFSFSMKIKGKDLYIATGTRDGSSSGTFNPDFITAYKNSQWTSFNAFNVSGVTSFLDIVSLEVDPNDENHIFAASWGRKGVAEIKNRALVNKFIETNSSLQVVPGSDILFAGGLNFDQNGNLWMINSRVPSPISVLKKADNSWKSFAFDNSPFDIANKPIHDLIIDSYNQKWVIVPDEGLMVFNENGTIDNESDDHARLIKFSLNTGSGNQQGNPLCIAEDKEGSMWIGTTYGIALLYSAGDALSSSSLPQQILVEKDGIAQYLLETETITAIAIDGANRKWIGTARNGVFFLSADGTKEISHFNMENSPILSNEISSIAILSSGEIFIGTGEGLVSYRGTANEGGEEFKNVYAFPNPVPSGYSGSISITGLVPNVNVKITDIAGRLVYETKSEGGQANWNGLSLNGEKINSGVYLVFCTTAEGEKTFITKILFLK